MGLWATLRHIRRLTDVEERLRELEAQMKALDREWSDASDHLRTMLGKIAKRAKAIEKAESEAGQHAEVGVQQNGVLPEAPLPFGSKTALIMRQIAARRGGG